jgi:hypothetical protein
MIGGIPQDLARAIERLADLSANIRAAQLDLHFCNQGVEEGFWPQSRLDAARQQLATNISAIERDRVRPLVGNPDKGFSR